MASGVPREERAGASNFRGVIEARVGGRTRGVSGRTSVLDGPLDAQRLELLVEVAALEPQLFGRLRHLPAVALEGGEDDAIARGAPSSRRGRSGAGVPRRDRSGSPRCRTPIDVLDDEDRDALHRVPQLANVPGPAVAA